MPVMIVLSNPVSPDADAAYNEWYDTTHAPQLIEHVPGILRARRYRLDDTPTGHRYLAVYEVQGTPEEVLRDLREASTQGLVESTDTLERDPAPIMVFADQIAEFG